MQHLIKTSCFQVLVSLKPKFSSHTLVAVLADDCSRRYCRTDTEAQNMANQMHLGVT